MNIHPTFTLAYTLAERGTEFDPQWGCPGDCLTALYIQGERPDRDQLVPEGDHQFASPRCHEESASWAFPSARLVWRGRGNSHLYLVEDAHACLLSRSGQEIEPKWDPAHKQLYFRSPRDGSLMCKDAQLLAGVRAFDLTPDGAGLIYCQREPQGTHVQRLDLKAQSTRSLCHCPGDLTQIRLSPDERHLAAVDSQDGQVKIIDLANGLSTQVSQPALEALAESEGGLSFSDPVRATPDFSPDGQRVLYVRTHTEETDTQERAYGSIFAALPPWVEGDHAPCRILGGRDYDGVLLLHNLHVRPGSGRGHNEARV